MPTPISSPSEHDMPTPEQGEAQRPSVRGGELDKAVESEPAKEAALTDRQQVDETQSNVHLSDGDGTPAADAVRSEADEVEAHQNHRRVRSSPTEAFAGIFSIDFTKLLTHSSAPVVHVLAMVVAAGMAVFGWWGFIESLVVENVSGMYRFGSLINAVMLTAFGLFIIGASRILLEFFVRHANRDTDQ